MASVWHRGQYEDEAGRSVAFKVQDVTPDLHDRLIEYYKTQFIHDEVISKHTRFAEDEVRSLSCSNLPSREYLIL